MMMGAGERKNSPEQQYKQIEQIDQQEKRKAPVQLRQNERWKRRVLRPVKNPNDKVNVF